MPPGYGWETGQGSKRADKCGDQPEDGGSHKELQGGRGERACDRLAELGVGAGLNRQKSAGEKCKKDKNCFHSNSPLVRWSKTRSDSESRDRESPLDVS